MGCNKCISSCTIIGANIATTEKNKRTISVNSDMCVHCGNCIKNCIHGAREYADDTEKFINCLENGENISVIISPDFYFSLGEKANNILGYLKKLGVKKIYDAGIGAMISLWAHVRYLKDNAENPDKAFIGQSCSAFVNLAECYNNDLTKYIIPVHSHMICAGIYINKYLGDKSKLVFLSPCISKKDELVYLKKMGIDSLNVTFNHIFDYVDAANVDIYDYYAESDVKSSGFGMLFSFAGMFKEAVSLFFPKTETMLSYDALDQIKISTLKAIISKHNGVMPFFAEIVNCDNGCAAGPGTITNRKEYSSIFEHFKISRDAYTMEFNPFDSPEVNTEKLCQMFKDLKYEDFLRSFDNKIHETKEISKAQYDEIFWDMHKTTHEKRHINCGSCGYRSCHEMVRAIACGYNKMENCIHYMHDELQIRYFTDFLTDIPNAEGFNSYAEEKMTENPDITYAVAVAGINELNVINELYGFKVGDMVIKKAANVFSSFTIRNLGIVGRLAGGEFLFCFEYSEDVMNNLSEIISFDCKEYGVAFPSTVRMGIYIDTDRKKTINSMVNLAQLTKDKLEETSTYSYLIYNEEISQRIALEAYVTAQMHNALTQKEFVPFFQPQYNHKNHKMVGAEVLCRWFREDGKMVSPGVFIPIFEKSGFVKQLDKYMWDKAFETMRTWIDEGKPFVPLSVNISRVSIIEDDFVDTIAALNDKYKIPPEYIHFEITESAYARKPHIIIERINKVREMGFKIAMDDFGSGYSSLNTLKDVPIDILKLDMGFLRGDNADNGESIIRHVVSMAKELGLSIVTEGVEKLEQADFLKHVGCSIVQGFYYARPMSKDNFEELCYTSI